MSGVRSAQKLLTYQTKLLEGPPPRVPRVFRTCATDGSPIDWYEGGCGSYSGWGARLVEGSGPTPCVGDVLYSRMESGKLAAFRFRRVIEKDQLHPTWLAEVEDIDYEQEPNIVEEEQLMWHVVQGIGEQKKLIEW
jgi:hypothetical protein